MPTQSVPSLLPSTLPTATSEVLLQPHLPATGVVSVAAVFQSSAASPMERPLPAVSLLTSRTSMTSQRSSVWDPTLLKPSRRGSPDYIKRTCLRPVMFTLSPWFLHPRTLIDLPCQGVFFSRLDALHYAGLFIPPTPTNSLVITTRCFPPVSMHHARSFANICKR